MKHAIGAVKTIARAWKFDSGLTPNLILLLVRISCIGATLKTDSSNRKTPCVTTFPGYARVDEFRENGNHCGRQEFSQ
jgi:hypothetical protein